MAYYPEAIQQAYQSDPRIYLAKMLEGNQQEVRTPLQGLSNLAGTLVGAYQRKQTNADYDQRAKDYQQTQNEAYAKLMSGDNEGAFQVAASNPYMGDFAGGLAMSAAKQRQEAQKPYTLSAGERMYNPDGTVRAENPKEPDTPAEIRAYEYARGQGYKGSLFDYKREISAAGRAPPSPRTSFRAMTPDEVKSAGLPAGTSAQISSDGKIDVVNKPPMSALSPKQAQAVRDKIQTIALARQQLQNVKDQFGGNKTKGVPGIKNTMLSSGLGVGVLPTPGGKQFDAAVDGLRTTIRQLTRTPGEGAMSDYESRLAQAQIPSRNNYEAVTEQQIQQLDDMMNLLYSGYSDLAGEMPGASPAKPAGPQPGTVENGYRFKGGNPADPKSWEKVQ